MITHPGGDRAQSCLTLAFESECSCSVPLTLSVGWCIPSVFDSSEKRQSCADLTICGGKGEPWQSKYVCVWPFVLKCTVFVYAQLWRQICSELLRYLFWSTQGLLGICWSLTMVSFEGTVDRSPSAYTGICFELHTFCHRQCSAGRIFFLNCWTVCPEVHFFLSSFKKFFFVISVALPKWGMVRVNVDVFHLLNVFYCWWHWWQEKLKESIVLTVCLLLFKKKKLSCRARKTLILQKKIQFVFSEVKILL